MTFWHGIARSAALAILFAMVPGVGSGAIINGGFESFTVDPNTGPFQFINLSSGLPGWTIQSGNIDHVGSYWLPQSGSYSIDLNGVHGPGIISQTVATVAGGLYELTFWMAGNPDSGPATKSLRVTAADATGTGVLLPQSQDYSFLTVLGGAAVRTVNMNWTQQQFSFLAETNSTTLTFQSLVTTSGSPLFGAAFGPALDNVSLAFLGGGITNGGGGGGNGNGNGEEVIPEPHTWILLASGMALLVWRRRRSG